MFYRSLVSNSIKRFNGQQQRLYGSAPPGPFGPLHFEGANWTGKGALPFQVKRRGQFLTLFTIFCSVGFFLPFISVETNIAPKRAEARKAKLEAAQ